METAVISSKGENVSCSIWNPFSNTLLSSYLGGGSCSNHGLAVNHGYVIANELNKPMLHVWPLNKQHYINKRLIAPGKITCVSISNDGNYIALSVDCKVHVYQSSSGVLCGTGGNHFQPINIIRFNPEGTFVGCGGEDGLLTVWHLGDFVRIDQTAKKPYLSINAHSLPITDLVFSSGDLNSRIYTTSLDRACKIHNIWTKDRLFSGHFENQLSCIALCPKESAIYLGDTDGNIRQIDLLSPPRKVNNHYSNTSKELSTTKFHEGRINSLSVSLDKTLLLSGSNDSTVKLIHIKSRQCLQTITQKGPITNCFFYVIPTDCFSNTFKPSIELNDFKSKETNFTIEICTPCDIRSNFDVNLNESSSTANNKDIDNLKIINNQLYEFAMGKLLNEHSHQYQQEVFVKKQEHQEIKENDKSTDKNKKNTARKRKR